MDLVDQYRLMHEAGHFPGYTFNKYRHEIAAFKDSLGAVSVLDYGSGKGLQHRDSDWDLVLYDPAVPGIDKKPTGEFDLVVSTDVLEHVPEEDVEEVISDILNYARKGVFLSICTRPARKVLPDGRNCHLTVRDEFWWRSRLLSDLKMEIRFEDN